MHYLAQEQSNFADFNKTEDFYKEKAIRMFKQYNANQDILKQKRDEFNRVLMSLDSEVLFFYQIQHGDINGYYDPVIEKLTNLIKEKEHDMECYKNIFKRLYKSNYLFKKRYEEEVMYWNINDLQFNKYHIIDDNSNIAKNKMTSSVNQLKKMIKVNTIEHNNELDLKKKEFTNLQEEVSQIKEDMKLFEDQIGKVKDRRAKVQDKYEYQSALNNKLEQDYIKAQIDYYILKAKICQLYNSMHAKDLSNTIIKLNEIKKKDRLLENQLYIVNKEINKLLNTLTQLEFEKENILKQTEDKSNDYSYYINTQTNSEVLTSNIQKSKIRHKAIGMKTLQKTNDFQVVLVFLLSYISQIVKVLHLNIHNVTHFFHYFKYFSVENEVYTLNFNEIDFDNAFFHFSLKLFCDFVPIASAFFAKTFDMIANRMNMIYSNSNDQQSDDLTSPPFSPKKPQSICYNITEVAKSYNKSVQSVSIMIMKKKEMSRNGNEIIKRLDEIIKSCQLNNDSSQGNKYKLESSPDQIYQSYLAYLESNSTNKNVKSFFNQHPKRSKALISKYSNHLVKTEQFEKPKATAKSFGPIVYEEKEDIPLPEIDNSFDESSQQPQHKSKGRKKKERFIATAIEREKQVIFERMNDLFKLELNYFKNRDKNMVNTDSINAKFYHFKKDQERRKITSRIKRRGLTVLEHIVRNRNQSMKQLIFSSNPTDNLCCPSMTLNKNCSNVNIGSTNSIKDNESTMMTVLPMPNSIPTQNINCKTKSRFHSTHLNTNNSHNLYRSKTITTNESLNTQFCFSKGFNNKGKTIFSALRKTSKLNI